VVRIPTVRVAEAPTDAFVLDVREPEEWSAGHVPGSHHVPMMEIPARAAELPSDRDVLVVCRVGQRSAHVVAFLRQRGFDNAWNLDGGLEAWAAAGRPLVRADGSAGYVA
jgi:rhodanese-related sulfurtransferase